MKKLDHEQIEVNLKGEKCEVDRNVASLAEIRTMCAMHLGGTTLAGWWRVLRDLLAAYDELRQENHDLRGDLHNCGMRCARLEQKLRPVEDIKKDIDIEKLRKENAANGWHQ